MLSNVLKVGMVAGSCYCAYKAGDEVAKAMPATTQRELVRNMLIAGAMGFGIGCAAPITAPIGIGWAAYDIYKHRDTIARKTKALRDGVKHFVREQRAAHQVGREIAQIMARPCDTVTTE